MTKERIPQSLKECYLEDGLSGKLKSWSERLEHGGEIIFRILIIVGIISTIVDGIEAKHMEDITGGSVWVTIISSLIIWSLYAAIEYFVYRALSLLIAALASIVENTRITANVALYSKAKEERLAVKTTPVDKGSGEGTWRCSKCGRIMPQYTGTCACGNTKYEN